MFDFNQKPFYLFFILFFNEKSIFLSFFLCIRDNNHSNSLKFVFLLIFGLFRCSNVFILIIYIFDFLNFLKMFLFCFVSIFLKFKLISRYKFDSNFLLIKMLNQIIYRYLFSSSFI